MIKRWLPRILLVAAAAIGIAAALAWWQDRGLNVVADRLTSGDAAVALAAADRFLDEHPNHSRAVRLRARSLVVLGKAEEALRLFAEVGADEPDDIRAWAKAYMSLGQFEPALQIFESLEQIEKIPNADTFESLSKASGIIASSISTKTAMPNRWSKWSCTSRTRVSRSGSS